mmetsp:Transcript_391/g.770  ORF Transcript_391/g.770 Transcript_391/m.770 type:complete len:111 (-) Transcript_391:1437-1769(-)
MRSCYPGSSTARRALPRSGEQVSLFCAIRVSETKEGEAREIHLQLSYHNMHINTASLHEHGAGRRLHVQRTAYELVVDKRAQEEPTGGLRHPLRSLSAALHQKTFTCQRC